MEHILFICNLLISIVGILYAARTVYMAVGLFQTRTFAPAKALHTYAVVIAARNEEIDKQVTELENLDIIGIVRENEVTPEQLAELIQSLRNGENA